MYFEYGEQEIKYLKRKDKKLGEIIDKIGFITRETEPDLFSSVIHHIVGQQISTKAQQSIWKKMNNKLGIITPDTITNLEREELQKFGITFKKADYILDFAQKVKCNAFDLEAIKLMSNEKAIIELSGLKGIGIWTAEMILLFCLQRVDIFSYGDLAILRGIRMVYHHKSIDKKRFEKYRKRFSPYGSIASLYFRAVANGAIPEIQDYAPQKIVKK